MSPPVADAARWDERIARARLLAAQHPAAAEMLSFYAEVATFQRTRAFAWTAAQGQPTDSDFALVASAVPALIELLTRMAPARLARAAREMRAVEVSEWRALIERYWNADAHQISDVDEEALFVVETALQPFAEGLASARVDEGAPIAGVEPRPDALDSDPQPARCPACGGKPVVGVLREAAHSARRSLVCGLCLTEWPWPRIVCPSCGETGFDALPVFRADEYPAARVDACESCRTYLKTIDLSKDGLAVPIVDELAAVPLDLWAREQGYAKLRVNLLRV